MCLVHLYTLEGAIQDIEFNSLSEDKKKGNNIDHEVKSKVICYMGGA